MGTSRKRKGTEARRVARDQARESNARSLRIRQLLNARKECVAELHAPDAFGGLLGYMAAGRINEIDRALFSEWYGSGAE